MSGTIYFPPSATSSQKIPRTNDSSIFPDEIQRIILLQLDFNSGCTFQDYINLRLVCKQWNQFLTSEAVTKKILNPAFCDELLTKHPAFNRVYWQQFSSQCVGALTNIPSTGVVSLVANKVNHLLGDSWNFTKQQIISYRINDQRRYYGDLWDNLVVNSDGTRRLPARAPQDIGKPPFPYEGSWVEKKDEWFNQDSRLMKWVSRGLVVYNIYNVSVTLYNICQNLNNSKDILGSDTFREYSAYPKAYCEDEVLQNYCCPISRKVMVLPIKILDGHAHIGESVDYVSIIQNTQDHREQWKWKKWEFDYVTLRKIRDRIAVIRSSSNGKEES